MLGEAQGWARSLGVPSDGDCSCTRSWHGNTCERKNTEPSLCYITVFKLRIKKRECVLGQIAPSEEVFVWRVSPAFQSSSDTWARVAVPYADLRRSAEASA